MIESLEKVIYVLNSEVEEGCAPQIEAVFDSLEGAKGYFHRFKTRSKLLLTIHTLNPDYYSDHKSDCYSVDIDMKSFTVRGIEVDNESGAIYFALTKTFDAVIGPDGRTEILLVFVMASSAEEATIWAIEMARNYHSIN